MPGNGHHTTLQLLQFTVPGMPLADLVLPLPRVLEVGDLPPVTSLPFTPFFVRGVSQWRGQLITVIDLAALLRGQPLAVSNVFHREHQDKGHQYVTAQVVVEQRIEPVAWPILFGAKTIAVPPKLEQASPLDDATSWLVFSVVVVEGDSLYVLDIDQAVDGFVNSQTFERVAL